jgi:hypothetical protein
MAAILAVVAASQLVEGGTPGAGGWIAMALSALGALYEERWIFDAKGGLIAHRVGLMFLCRKDAIPLDSVEGFRLAPFVRGTLPGSADEAAENAAALAGARADDRSRRRAFHKKPYLCLLLQTVDGATLFIEALPARRAAKMKEQASRIAEACSKPLVEA